MKQVISTPLAPAAIGPYSQAIAQGGLIFTSGQIPLDPRTGELVGESIEAQAECVMQNLKAVLQAAGGAGAGGQDNLLFGRSWRFCGVQRGLRRLFPDRRPGALLLPGGRPSQSRARGSGGRRGEVMIRRVRCTPTT